MSSPGTGGGTVTFVIPMTLLRVLRVVLVVAAVALAAVPLFVLLDLARGGTGFGLCPGGITRCRNPYTAAPELSTGLTVGLFVILAALRIVNRLRGRIRSHPFNGRR